jgi:membrane protein YdbS with pleckstrin-like domain
MKRNTRGKFNEGADHMASEWFVKLGDQHTGPFSSRQLKEMAQKGQVTRSASICKGENGKPDGKWVIASKAKGLFADQDSDNQNKDVLNSRQETTEKKTSPPITSSFAPSEEMSGEKCLYTARPCMFRNNPIAFSLCIILILFGGLGLLFLLFWWLKVKGTKLTISNERVSLRKGILSKFTTEVFLTDIRNIQISQSFFQRIFNVGSVGIATAGHSGMEIEVSGLPNPKSIKQLVDQHRR